MQNPIIQRKLLAAPEGRKLVDPYAVKLATIPFKAWEEFREDYQKHDKIYDPSLKAHILHAHMVKFAQELGLTENGLKYVNPYSKQHMLSIEKRALVRFKKMDDDLNTSNIPTIIQERINSRQLNIFPEGNFKHLFNVGYIPTETWSGIKKIVLAEVYNDVEPIWKIEFSSNLDVTFDGYGTIDMFDQPTAETEEPEVEVRLKKNNK